MGMLRMMTNFFILIQKETSEKTNVVFLVLYNVQSSLWKLEFSQVKNRCLLLKKKKSAHYCDLCSKHWLDVHPIFLPSRNFEKHVTP